MGSIIDDLEIIDQILQLVNALSETCEQIDRGSVSEVFEHLRVELLRRHNGR